jgi:hypothetical protein
MALRSLCMDMGHLLSACRAVTIPPLRHTPVETTKSTIKHPQDHMDREDHPLLPIHLRAIRRLVTETGIGGALGDRLTGGVELRL